MVRRVRAYLSHMVVINDEGKLNDMSFQCEPPPGEPNLHQIHP